MRCLPNSAAALVLLTSSALLGACSDDAPPAREQERLQIALMTSLPIYWSGGDAFAELADRSSETHWARAALEQRHAFAPIDSLAPETLAATDVLILAQPRALAPGENVALDDWVKGGGRVLVFADPVLVGESPFALGDPRRPMDTVLLSPILSRWGLELTFDPDEADLRRVRDGTLALDVAAAGAWVPSEAGGVQCAIRADGVLAECAVGAGRAVLLADATFLEDSLGGDEAQDALFALIDRAVESDPGPSRENKGGVRE